MPTSLFVLAVALVALGLAYRNVSGVAWIVTATLALVVAWFTHALPYALTLVLAVVGVIVALPLVVPTLRRSLISDGVLRLYRRIMPPMSQTEREALEAGTVWWDGELFSGRPDWQRLLATRETALTPE